MVDPHTWMRTSRWMNKSSLTLDWILCKVSIRKWKRAKESLPIITECSQYAVHMYGSTSHTNTYNQRRIRSLTANTNEQAQFNLYTVTRFVRSYAKFSVRFSLSRVVESGACANTTFASPIIHGWKKNIYLWRCDYVRNNGKNIKSNRFAISN